MAAVEAAFAEEMKAQEEKDAIERDCLPGSGGGDLGDAAAAGSGAGPLD